MCLLEDRVVYIGVLILISLLKVNEAIELQGGKWEIILLKLNPLTYMLPLRHILLPDLMTKTCIYINYMLIDYS